MAAGPTPRASSTSKTKPAISLELPTSALAEHVTEHAVEHAGENLMTGRRLLDALPVTERRAAEPRSWAAGVAASSSVPLPLDRLPLQQSMSSAGPVPSRGATAPSPRAARAWWNNSSEGSFCDSCVSGRRPHSSSSPGPSRPPVGQQQQQHEHVPNLSLPLHGSLARSGALTPPRVIARSGALTPPVITRSGTLTPPRFSSQPLVSPRLASSRSSLLQLNSGPPASCSTTTEGLFQQVSGSSGLNSARSYQQPVGQGLVGTGSAAAAPEPNIGGRGQVPSASATVSVRAPTSFTGW